MPLDLKRIQALCFDVDGTLNDTDDRVVHKLTYLLRPVRFLLPGKDPHRAARRSVMWIEAPGNVLIGLPDTLGLDDELVALVDFVNRHRPKRFRHFQLIPGVKEMLERLYKRYPMSVVSARDETTTRQFLEKFGLTLLFKCVATALTAEHTKPYPHPILWTAEQMGVAPEACLMIGDTTVDIRAGRAAGAQTVGVLCGFGEEAELSCKGADLILPTTADLADVLIKT